MPFFEFLAAGVRASFMNAPAIHYISLREDAIPVGAESQYKKKHPVDGCSYFLSDRLI
jgi:hypothetical protein